LGGNWSIVNVRRVIDETYNIKEVITYLLLLKCIKVITCFSIQKNKSMAPIIWTVKIYISKEKWYLNIHFLTTLWQPSLSYSHCIFILSLLLLSNKKRGKRLSLKVVGNWMSKYHSSFQNLQLINNSETILVIFVK